MGLRRHGLAVAPPPGWSARLYQRQAEGGARGWPVLHAATLPVPADAGDFGSGVAAVMGPRDALVVLFEYGPESVGQPLFAAAGPPRPTPADFHPSALQRTLPGQSGYQRFFTWRRRAFCLYIVLGSHQLRGQLTARARELLDTVSVTDDRPGGGP